jgi:hypothetical protein
MNMVGSKTSGNPNIVKNTKGHHTGPRSKLGKLKCSLNAHQGRLDRVTPQSMLGQLMEKAGMDFSKRELIIEKANLFVVWLRSKKNSELNEIAILEDVIRLLEYGMQEKIVDKMDMGMQLDDDDLKWMKNLREALESSHRLKYGEKKVNLHVEYQDIRERMMKG